MASTVVLCAVLTMTVSLLTEIGATTVEVTVPVDPVTVGRILPVQCQIRGFEDTHTVKMFRVINGQTEEITTGVTYIPSSLGQRVFITERTMPGGILVYFMTIIDVSMLDQGQYLCQIYALTGSGYDKVAEGSTNVEIYFLPDSIYPMCQSTPALIENMNEGDELTFTCISAKGAPAVALRWLDNFNQETSSRSKTLDDTVSSEVSLRTSRITHGTVFICEMTSPGFTDFIRTCKIGPITIKKATEARNMEILKPIVATSATKQKTVITKDCNIECPNNNKYTILYLSVATVGSAMLCVVFLITTIVMCCKYQKISSDLQDPQGRNITGCDGSEPVYVSLQRRVEPPPPDRSSLYRESDRRPIYKEPDRSSTYMSVEDPNNPGSKVLMPKEVFEEFYNSLSLKRV